LTPLAKGAVLTVTHSVAKNYVNKGVQLKKIIK
jgi:hypothetical protein